MVAVTIYFALFNRIKPGKSLSCVNLDSSFLAVSCFVAIGDSSICS
jgi:hypothetical protein